VKFFFAVKHIPQMGKKINYSVNYKKELAKALDEKYRNIY